MNTRTWKAVYDSVVGTSHTGSALPCQDACRVVEFSVDGETIFAACCADGAGSAQHADEGSEIACDTFIQLAQRDCQGLQNDESVVQHYALQWLHEIRTRLEERATELDVPVRQLATTFLGVVIGENTAVFIQIGDGAIVVRNGDDYRAIFWPQSGEFANTTNFITDSGFAAAVECTLYQERVDEIAIFSDGLERLILRFADRVVHRPFLEPLFAALRQSDAQDEYFEQLRAFLDSPRVNERTDDDKTLVLATRMNSPSDPDALR